MDTAALRDAGFGQRGRLLRGAKAGQSGTNMNGITQHHGLLEKIFPMSDRPIFSPRSQLPTQTENQNCQNMFFVVVGIFSELLGYPDTPWISTPFAGGSFRTLGEPFEAHPCSSFIGLAGSHQGPA